MSDLLSLYDIVKKLIGPINPVADSSVDRIRLENLRATTALVEKLIFDIDAVACMINRHEASVKSAANHASEFLSSLGIEE